MRHKAQIDIGEEARASHAKASSHGNHRFVALRGLEEWDANRGHGDLVMRNVGRMVWIAWFLAAIFYLYQYALRSSPAVMMPELSGAYGLTPVGMASLLGIFYYGYAVFSLIAGAALDRLGPRAVIPLGALIVACGALLFSTGNLASATIGRLLQGVGGSVSLVGTVFIAARNFPPWRAATLIGAAQMFGMFGGFAGQFPVGRLLSAGVRWDVFWMHMGLAGLLLSLILFLVLPAEAMTTRGQGSIRSAFLSLAAVFRNPQSILCGAVAGLLFLPTTIFDMMWGVRFLQEAHGFDYGEAVIRSATVPLGWMIGCPLLGWVSDRIGRRKPVVIAGASVTFTCLAWILYGPTGVFPPYVLGLLAGVSSGSAMIPYTIIKEANPPGLSGTATGVLGCLNLSVTALLGPVFGRLLHAFSRGATPGLTHYQSTFQPLLFGVGMAVLLTLALKETGAAPRTLGVITLKAA